MLLVWETSWFYITSIARVNLFDCFLGFFFFLDLSAVLADNHVSK